MLPDIELLSHAYHEPKLKMWVISYFIQCINYTTTVFICEIHSPKLPNLIKIVKQKALRHLDNTANIQKTTLIGRNTKFTYLYKNRSDILAKISVSLAELH